MIMLRIFLVGFRLGSQGNGVRFYDLWVYWVDISSIGWVDVIAAAVLYLI